MAILGMRYFFTQLTINLQIRFILLTTKQLESALKFRELPHHTFLCDNRHDSYTDNDYLKYLECSWDYHYGKEYNKLEKRRQKIDDYISIFHDIKDQYDLGIRGIENPINVC